MSYFQKDVYVSISKSLKNIQYEKVSDLSKGDFEKLLSTALYGVLNSRDFERHIRDIAK